jgi:hypothetical protein
MRGVVTPRRAERERDALRAPSATPTGAELAWIAALPCALLTLAAVVVLGPPLGHALFVPHGERLWPSDGVYVFGHPEPVKHARYVLALLGAVLLAAVALAGSLRPPRLSRGATRTLVLASQLLLCAGLVVATAAQQHVTYPDNLPTTWRIFSVPTLVAALALAAAATAALHRPPVIQRLRRRDTARRWSDLTGFAIATAATALWLLPSLGTEHTAANGPFSDLPPWAMGDAYAILDGRTPLVNFHALYGQLWGYVAAIPMALFGATIGVFTVVMVVSSAAALLAIYAVLRRVVRDALLALALYLPFLATSLFVVAAPTVAWRASNASIYSVWPMRYAGPFVLVWLTARQLDRARPRAAWPLALVAGLVCVNNVEFGLPALLATLVALACDPRRWSRAVLARLAADMAAGLVGAAALVSLLTLARTGSLPRFELLFEFPRVFGVLGLAAMPMATLGFHLALYATFAAALATAAVRIGRRERDALLTGLLAWSGVFGLLAGSYFAGRSDAMKLAALFPAWGLSLMLLLVVVVRDLTARRWRLPSPAELAVLVGFGLATCSLAQLSPPWHEVSRLRAGSPQPLFPEAFIDGFVHAYAAPGERVTILIQMGHRVAHTLGLVNVSPYATIEEIVTRRQLRTVLDAAHAEDAHKLFVPDVYAAPEHLQMFARAGYTQRASAGPYSYWADRTVPR